METLAVGEGMGNSTLIVIIGLVLGNGTLITVFITGLFNRRKAAAEARLTDADATKVGAETVASTSDALIKQSLSLLQPYTDALARFSNEATRLQAENDTLKHQQEEAHRETVRLREDNDDLRREQASLLVRNRVQESQIRDLEERLQRLGAGVRDAEDKS